MAHFKSLALSTLLLTIDSCRSVNDESFTTPLLRLGRSSTFKQQVHDVKTSAVPDLDNVVNGVAKFVWDGPNGPTPFVILGSYPAHLLASEQGLDLQVNDIDVVLQSHSADKLPKCKDETTTNPLRLFTKSNFYHNLISNSDMKVQIVESCLDPLKQYYKEKSFDINSIAVSLTVEPKMTSDGSVVPNIKGWTADPAFDEFLHTKTLSIVEKNVLEGVHFHENVVISLIRLIKKAQEMELDYTLPSSQALSKLHGTMIRPLFKEYLLDTLNEEYKSEIYNDFDLVSVYDGKGYVFVLKGHKFEIPTLEEVTTFSNDPFLHSYRYYDNCCTHNYPVCDSNYDMCNSSKTFCETKCRGFWIDDGNRSPH